VFARPTHLAAAAAVAVAVLLGSASAASADPVIAAAGDIACDPAAAAFNAGAGVKTQCRQGATSNLVAAIAPDAVLTLGDHQYTRGTYEQFMASYDPSWGRAKDITFPAVGNHEYDTPGAAGYFRYFGTAAGDPAKGYHSTDIGAWHVVALNSNCAIVACAAGSAQEQWLRADLAAHPTACTLAYWHHARFSSGPHGDEPQAAQLAPLWEALYDAGADVVLNAHDHDYERFAPQTPAGAGDPVRGLREFVVGTGGRSHYAAAAPIANSEVINSATFGVLVLTLHATGYDWQFAPEAGATFTDTGSQDCHWAPVNTTAPAITGTAQDGQTLSASTGTWSAEPAPKLTYAWRRCDLQGLACRGITGATNPVYRLTSADVGSRIRVRVYAANALGSTYAPSPATPVVAATPPVNWKLPVISGTPQEGAILTTDSGGWSGTKPMAFSYAWRRCDADGLICRSIPGATASAYRVTADDVGWPIRVRVYASNAAGSAYVPSKPTEIVASARPEVAAAASR
jgi:calcineurin-like phosphoesterase family protein